MGAKKNYSANFMRSYFNFGKLIFIILSTLTLNINAASPGTFDKAKKIAYQIFEQHPVTIYCGCQYHGHQIDLGSCGMQAAETIKRAHRLEWEHMMPAENFGRQLTCWYEKVCTKENGQKYKGRKCCDNTSEQFKIMESELYNLWPAVGLVNQARSNYRFSEVGNINLPTSNFYGCHVIIDKKLRKIEPRDEAKGIVARANLFMSEKYGIKLSQSQRLLFEAWSKKYPPSQWEIQWAAKIASIEGYTNPFVQWPNL